MCITFPSHVHKLSLHFHTLQQVSIICLSNFVTCYRCLYIFGTFTYIFIRVHDVLLFIFITCPYMFYRFSHIFTPLQYFFFNSNTCSSPLQSYTFSHVVIVYTCSLHVHNFHYILILSHAFLFLLKRFHCMLITFFLHNSHLIETFQQNNFKCS